MDGLKHNRAKIDHATALLPQRGDQVKGPLDGQHRAYTGKTKFWPSSLLSTMTTHSTDFLFLLSYAHMPVVKFSEKATKIDKIFSINLTICGNSQIDVKDFVNFCGLLRKHELYP